MQIPNASSLTCAPQGLTVVISPEQQLYITALVRWYEDRSVRSTGQAWDIQTDHYVACLAREWLLATGIVKCRLQGLTAPGREL